MSDELEGKHDGVPPTVLGLIFGVLVCLFLRWIGCW
jgi:hypothetical protein